jgi:hypothetical protein
VLDRWYEPTGIYFKVRTTQGKTYILRYDEQPDEWTLQSGFDGDELLARRNLQLMTVSADVIRRAERMLAGCETCALDDAQVPFNWVLDKVTGSDPKTVDYLIIEPVHCPRCAESLTEYTLVDLKDDDLNGEADSPETPEPQLKLTLPR